MIVVLARCVGGPLDGVAGYIEESMPIGSERRYPPYKDAKYKVVYHRVSQNRLHFLGYTRAEK